MALFWCSELILVKSTQETLVSIFRQFWHHVSVLVELTQIINWCSFYSFLTITGFLVNSLEEILMFVVRE